MRVYEADSISIFLDFNRVIVVLNIVAGDRVGYFILIVGREFAIDDWSCINLASVDNFVVVAVVVHNIDDYPENVK